ncbi:DMT family transporter [Rudaea sp.]|uniref:DMT family transporter n=1 Tax=Rudaea sp. TaxID=2136325 RepID=UPI002ED30F1B
MACGIGAGALWGLVFLAPELARGFSPLQLSVGRYLCYGLIAAVLIAPRWRALTQHIHHRQWWNLVWLAFAGNTLYYILMSNAVQTGGIAMTSLVIGFLPVAVTIIGSRDRNAVPLHRLLPSLLLCAAGAVCIGWQVLARPTIAANGQQMIGLLCAIGALASWTAYAVGNARCLIRLQHVSSHDWNLLIGIVTGLQNLVLLPLALVLETAQHSTGEWMRFGAVSIGVAVLASIVGNALWNRMSRLLPLTLVGQMILFETVFALIYGFLWERRWPTSLEMAALALVVMSVFSCLAAHRRPAAIERSS